MFSQDVAEDGAGRRKSRAACRQMIRSAPKATSEARRKKMSDLT